MMPPTGAVSCMCASTIEACRKSATADITSGLSAIFVPSTSARACVTALSATLMRACAADIGVLGGFVMLQEQEPVGSVARAGQYDYQREDGHPAPALTVGAIVLTHGRDLLRNPGSWRFVLKRADRIRRRSPSAA